MRAKAVLNSSWTNSSARKTTTHGRDQSDITGLIGQYAHGNEPSHAMAWMYDRWAGRTRRSGWLTAS
jgi:hypothetical protein